MSARPHAPKPRRNAAKTKKPKAPTRASSVEQRAKAEGAKGGRIGAAKTALRNMLIVQRATVDGWPWNLVAEEAGVSEKQCRRVVTEMGDSPSPLDQPPTKLIEEWARGYRQSVSTLTVLAANADNTSAAIGAVRAANEARDKLMALMQAVGHVPQNLGTLKVARDVEQVARAMFDAIEAFRRGDLDADGVVSVFQEAVGIPPVPELPPAS